MIGVEGGSYLSLVNLLGSSVWKFLLMWTRLVFAIVRLSIFLTGDLDDGATFLVSSVDKLDGNVAMCLPAD